MSPLRRVFNFVSLTKIYRDGWGKNWLGWGFYHVNCNSQELYTTRARRCCSCGWVTVFFPGRSDDDKFVTFLHHFDGISEKYWSQIIYLITNKIFQTGCWRSQPKLRILINIGVQDSWQQSNKVEEIVVMHSQRMSCQWRWMWVMIKQERWAASAGLTVKSRIPTKYDTPWNSNQTIFHWQTHNNSGRRTYDKSSDISELQELKKIMLK